MDYLPIFYSSLASILVLIALGFLLGKIKILNEFANKALANLLLSVAMPCALFIAFPHQFDPASFDLFLKAVLGAIAMMGSAIIVSRLLFSEKRLHRFYFQHQFAFIFNNASFLGYPLTMAIFGAESMIMYSGLMLVFNLALFSYGVWLFERSLSLKHLREIFFNPNIIAVFLGLLFFINSWNFPKFIDDSINYIAALTTPLSLLCIGFMLSQVRNWAKIFAKVQLFFTCGLQLILMPLLTFSVLWLLRMPTTIIQIFTMIQALPTATSLGLFAEKYGGNKIEASELVLISTILSVFTLPAVMYFVFKL